MNFKMDGKWSMETEQKNEYMYAWLYNLGMYILGKSGQEKKNDTLVSKIQDIF